MSEKGNFLKKPVLLIIPIISTLHKGRVLKPLKRVKSLLKKRVKVSSLKPVYDATNLPNIKDKNFDEIVVFVGSGGTSETIKKIASNKDWLILAYHENNSLASALNAKEKMVSEGIWKGKLFYTDLKSVPEEFFDEVYASKALGLIKNLRIGLFDDEITKLKEKIEFVNRHFQMETVLVPFEKLRLTMEEVPEKLVYRTLKQKLNGFRIVEPSKKDLEKALRLYLALRKIAQDENFGCVTFECFRFLKQTLTTPCLAFSFLKDEGIEGTCEAEILHIPVMLLLANLTGKPAWLANISGINFTKNTVTLAHCTAATKLSISSRKILVRSHFESGLSVALDVPLRKGVVTLTHVVQNPPTITIVEGKILRSQLKQRNLCRTQVEVSLNCDVKDFLETTGNHQVMGYGSLTSVLKIIAEKSGLKPIILGK